MTVPARRFAKSVAVFLSTENSAFSVGKSMAGLGMSCSQGPDGFPVGLDMEVVGSQIGRRLGRTSSWLEEPNVGFVRNPKAPESTWSLYGKGLDTETP